MKFNFKKVASVIASAVMITSTVGFAAAANYPAPFTSGATVVYGAAAPVDAAAAINIQSDLISKTASTGTTTTTTTTGGDSKQIKTASTLLHVGDYLTNVTSTLITSSDMPNLLADGTYRSHNSQDYGYTQTLQLYPVRFTQFSNNNFDNSVPTLGVHIPQSTNVMNYTVQFSTPLQSSVGTSSTNLNQLVDLQDTKITLLGTQYNLLNAYNGTNVQLVFMGGAASDTVNINEDKTLTVGNQTYDVKLTYVDTNTAKFTVNGETTDSITVGQTYKLSDGTQLGLKDVSYQAFAGGVMSADITLGAQKLACTNGQTVQLNDNNVNGLYCYINAQYSGSNTLISSMTFQWQTDDQVFLSQGSNVVFPGLNSVELTMGNLTAPTTETTKVLNNGNNVIELQTTLKDGAVNINLLNGNGTQFTSLGNSGSATGASNILVTNGSSSSGQIINFNSDNDEYFVATYYPGTSSSVGESYLLDARTGTQTSGSSITNVTYIREVGTGSSGTVTKCGGDNGITANTQCIIGNVALTPITINALAHTTTIQAGTNVVFNKLITKSGLLMTLPQVDSPTQPGWINVSSPLGNSTYALLFKEQDKNQNIGAGDNINVTLGQNGNSNSVKVEVADIQGNYAEDNSNVNLASNLPTTTTQSSVRTGYEASALATQVFLDTTNAPNTATLIYNGGETSGNVFVASTGAIVSPGSTGTGATINIITDADIASYENTNLIVVGGSCVNTVAATLLGSTTPLCGADFTAATQVQSGGFIIKTFQSPYASDKVAMLVAGWEADQTMAAAKKVITGVPTDVNSTDVEPTLTA